MLRTPSPPSPPPPCSVLLPALSPALNELYRTYRTSYGTCSVPKCEGLSCPSDVPSGVTARPTCALQDAQGNKYCALVCSPSAAALAYPPFKKAADDQCGTNASCKPISTVGICTYDD